MLDLIIKYFKDLLGANHFLSGGVVLMFLGGAMAGMRKFPAWLLQRCIKRITVSAYIGDSDHALKWLWGWLSKRNFIVPVRHFVLRTVQDKTDRNSYFKDRQLFTPVPGTYFFIYRGRIAWAKFTRDRVEKENNLIAYNEFLSVGMLFGSDKDVRQMIHDAKADFESMEKETVSVYAPRYSNWVCVAGRSIRNPSSLIMDKGIYEDLIDDIANYQKSRNWYLDVGIPWRRGYLLYGDPGNGKTSVVLTVAGQIGADIYTINLAAPGMTDEKFEFMVSDVPPGNIILLEEVDVAFNGRTAADVSTNLRVTFTGLLNSLDGVTTNEGRIVFMTTNHLEKLDPALIRPGRVDKLIHIANASHYQIERMYMKFFPDAEAAEATAFAQRFPDRGLCMAAIQEMFIGTNRNPSCRPELTTLKI